jgi:hypothetical protein
MRVRVWVVPVGLAERGVFIKDPEGQVERIAASGHLVAWSVRTPADTIRESTDEFRRNS